MLRRKAFTLMVMVGGLFVACTAGCDSCNGLKRYVVTGHISLDGEPVEHGYIKLVSLDPNTSNDGGEVVQGEFRFEAQAGKKKVVITAPHIVRDWKRMRAKYHLPESRKPPTVAFQEETVPPRYNTKTELTSEVTTGKNQIDFELQSDPKSAKR